MIDHINELGQPVGAPLPNWIPAQRPSKKVLNGRFCRLEPATADQHARQLFEANSADRTGKMWTYLPYGPFASLSDYRNWLEGASRSEDPLFFAIIDLNAGEPAGVASYLRIDPASGCIEVGHIAYSPALQRRLAATEAMFLLMQNAFELGYRRYEWKCDALNAPSRRAAQRLGFSFEGLFRQANVVKGRNRDTAWYSIIDREWPTLRSAFRQWLAPANFDINSQQHVRLSALTAPPR